MRLTLHQLKVFEAVAKYQSVTIAAKHLHMTQPAVSNIIKQLQIYYRCPLIETWHKKLQLTTYGEVLLKHCKQIEQTLENINEEITLMQGGMAGTIKLSIVSTAKYFVPSLLGEFKKQNNNIHFSLIVSNREEVIKRLMADEDDFVIMSHPPTNKNIEVREFYHDELVVITTPQYLNDFNSISKLADLKNCEWIMRETGSGTRHATEKIFSSYNFIPRIAMEISNTTAIKQLVMANIGLSVVSKQSIQNELKSHSIQCLNLKEFPVKHEWFLVKHPDKKLSPIAEKFYEFVKACC